METAIFEKPLFGDKMKVIIYDAEKDIASEVVDEMYEEALRLQKIFNFFDPESELSVLNSKRSLSVSPELLEVLRKSIGMSEATEGKYDVSLGKKILARKKAMGDEKKIPSGSYKDIKIKGNNVSLENPHAMIDLGSIAKGYITDRLGDFLREKGVKEFLIDSRGDILFSGKYNHIIGVKHPRKEEAICSIKVADSGVATSGDYNQYDGTFERSHILNATDAVSVTVVAKALEKADLLATAIFVSDRKQIEKIMKKNQDASALVIRKNLSQEYYNGFKELIS